jgi:hypothetical protein
VALAHLQTAASLSPSSAFAPWAGKPDGVTIDWIGQLLRPLFSGSASAGKALECGLNLKISLPLPHPTGGP